MLGVCVWNCCYVLGWILIIGLTLHGVSPMILGFASASSLGSAVK